MIKPTPEQTIRYVESNFPDHKTRKGGSEILINNPFSYDTGYNFNINVDKSICHCWHGDEWAEGGPKTFLRLVQMYEGCSFPQAVKIVCGKNADITAIYAKISKSKKKKEDERQYDIKLPLGSTPLANDISKNAAILKLWLASRGITEQMIDRYNLHSNATSVVWPYYEYESLVHWQERDRLNKRFGFPDGSKKGMYLYGFDMVEPNDIVIITEAIFDSMVLGGQVMASGGAILTSAQVRKIRALNPTDIILAPDNDSAGVNSLAENYNLLKPYFNSILYSIPPAIKYKSKDGKTKTTKDWNELGENKMIKWDKLRGLLDKGIKKLTDEEAIKIMVNR